MIWYYILIFITTLLTEIFSWLPKIDTLPSILGVDIDSQLISGVALFNAYSDVVWPIADVFTAFLLLLAYYVIKIVLRFFLGNRAP